MQQPFGTTPFIASFQLKWGTAIFNVVSAINCQITTVGSGNVRTPNVPPSNGPQTVPAAATFIATLNALPASVIGATVSNTTGVNDNQVAFTSQQIGVAAAELDIFYGPTVGGTPSWVPALGANEIALRYNAGTPPTGGLPAGSGGGTALLLNGAFNNCNDGSFTPEAP